MGKIPKATHQGIVNIGSVSFDAYVLEDGRRILSTRGIMKALGRRWRGRKYAGTQNPVFIEAKNLIPFITNDLDPVLASCKFKTTKGVLSEGYPAEILPKVCEIYLKARDAGNVIKNAPGGGRPNAFHQGGRG